MLAFKKLEKRIHDFLLIPAIDLQIEQAVIVSIHTNVKVREALIALLSCRTLPSSGEIIVEDILLTKKNRQNIQIYHLEPILYDYLTVKEMLLFIK